MKINHTTWGAGVVVLMLGAGCGGGGGGAGDEGNEGGASGQEDGEQRLATSLDNTEPPLALPEARSFYRVILRGSSSGVEVADVQLGRYQHLPPPSFSATHVLVARSETEALASIPFHFPFELRSSAVTDESVLHEVKEVSSATVTLYVEDAGELDRIDVFSGDAEVLTIDEDLLRAAQDAFEAELDELGMKRPQSLDSLRSAHPSVQFLEPGDEGLLADDLLAGGQIETIDAAWEGTIADGLEHVAPGMLGAVTHVGVVKWPKDSDLAESVVGRSVGSQLLLNTQFVDKPKVAAATLVHEIAHNFVHLSNALADHQAELDEWPDEVATAVRKVLRQHQLLAGLEDGFARLHASGVMAGLSQDYLGDGYGSLSIDQAHQAGFASPYGASSPQEDFAEYVQTTQIPTSDERGICPFLSRGQVHRGSAGDPLRQVGVPAFDRGDSRRCLRRLLVVGRAGFSGRDPSR